MDGEEGGPAPTLGEKKSVEEFLQMDAEDESLRKYKEALLGKAGDLGDPSDPRLVVLLEMKVIVKDNEGKNSVYDLSGADAAKQLKDKPFLLKEGCSYKIQLSFKCQHEIITGLQCTNTIYKKGIKVDRETVPLGSYPPSRNTVRTVTIPRNDWDEAPSGLLGRGKYKGETKFHDMDGKTHAEFEFFFAIKKDWK